jgi:hypothetical protein
MDTNFFNLSTTCYTVQNDKIVESTLKDFERFIEIEPTPHGIQRKYYIKRAISEQFSDEIGGRHLDFVSSPTVNDDVVYALLYWQDGGENILETFDDEQDAQNQLEEFAVSDILNNDKIVIHLNRRSAENELHNLLEDQAL